MPGYTEEQARIDISLSTDWERARKVSLKHWRQLASSDPYVGTYAPGDPCGYCFVATNHAVEANALHYAIACNFCPAFDICNNVDLNKVDPNDMIAAIENLKHTEEK